MTKRWDCKKSEDRENARVDAFLAEVIELSKKHGLSIAHEDGGGAFIIENFSEGSIKRLSNALMDVDD